MTTASVYYNARTGEPDFVLIDGSRAEIWPGTAGLETRDRVDRACRRLGWKIMADAPIVRQADGRGTVRIEPVDDAAPIGGPVAYVTCMVGDSPTRVSIDGMSQPVVTLSSFTGPTGADRTNAVFSVDQAIRRLGYRRTGSIEPATASTGWQCTVTPDSIAAADKAARDLDAQAGPADWRDHPTLMRMDDVTAGLLNELSEALGIPGDELAREWIRAAARDAQIRRRRFLSPGYLTDHTRIVGWLPDGSPRLDAVTDTPS